MKPTWRDRVINAVIIIQIVSTLVMAGMTFAAYNHW